MRQYEGRLVPGDHWQSPEAKRRNASDSESSFESLNRCAALFPTTVVTDPSPSFFQV